MELSRKTLRKCGWGDRFELSTANRLMVGACMYRIALSAGARSGIGVSMRQICSRRDCSCCIATPTAPFQVWK